MTRLRRIALLFTALVCGCSNDSVPPAESDTAPTESSIQPLVLIASGDTHGWLIPCGCTANQSGGLIRRATYIETRSDDAQTIVVDVGGALDGSAPYQVERFRAILRGESTMNYVAHNLGAAELALGKEKLTELSAETGVPFLSANANTNGTPIAAMSKQVASDSGLRLAITGVVSPKFANADVQISDPIDAVLNAVEDLEFDRLVVLAYMPVDELRELAANLPEADVIIGGPTGQALSPETSGQTLLLSATNKGKFLAEVAFTGAKGSVSGKVVEMSADIPDHPKQRDNLDAFRAFLEQRDFTAAESGFVDSTVQAGGSAIAGDEACGACHDETSDHWAGTAHAHAWQTLIDDAAHVDSYCQQCHTNGFGQPEGFLSAKRSPKRVNVGCEACHGPSSRHVENEAIKTPFDAKGICRKCHDPENSPAFEFDSYWEQVRHE